MGGVELRLGSSYPFHSLKLPAAMTIKRTGLSRLLNPLL